MHGGDEPVAVVPDVEDDYAVRIVRVRKSLPEFDEVLPAGRLHNSNPCADLGCGFTVGFRGLLKTLDRDDVHTSILLRIMRSVYCETLAPKAGCILGFGFKENRLAKYLVTGAAGFIGRSIAAALLERGDSVRGVDNFSTGKRENLVGLEAMDFVEGDLADPAVGEAVCDGVEVIFHEAALPSVPRSVIDPVGSNVACVDATVNLLWAAKQAGVRRVVYAASSSAYGDTPTLPKHEAMLPSPISPYAVAKLAGEYYMKSFHRVYGMETVALRYFNVFGPYQDPTSPYSGVLALFCRKMLAGETPTIYGDGETSRDFTFIANTVEGNLLAASAPAENVAGTVMNLATGVRITLNDVVEELRGITGYTGPVEYAPERAGDIKHSLADISIAGQLLGYAPVVDLREGLRRTVEWYREAGNRG
jgi:UDP-glucose 4-epimerase